MIFRALALCSVLCVAWPSHAQAADSTDRTTTVTVVNVAPTLSNVSADNVLENEYSTLTGNITDPGVSTYDFYRLLAAEPAAAQSPLQQAAEDHDQLADVLGELASHYEALEQGEPDTGREALRAAEQELGMADEIEARYAAAEQMAELAVARLVKSDP